MARAQSESLDGGSNFMLRKCLEELTKYAETVIGGEDDVRSNRSSLDTRQQPGFEGFSTEHRYKAGGGLREDTTPNLEHAPAEQVQVSSPHDIPKLPEGWKTYWSNNYSKWYFKNIYTKKTQWNKPTLPIYPGRAATNGPPGGALLRYGHGSAIPNASRINSSKTEESNPGAVIQVPGRNWRDSDVLDTFRDLGIPLQYAKTGFETQEHREWRERVTRAMEDVKDSTIAPRKGKNYEKGVDYEEGVDYSLEVDKTSPGSKLTDVRVQILGSVPCSSHMADLLLKSART